MVVFRLRLSGLFGHSLTLLFMLLGRDMAPNMPPKLSILCLERV
jgi:hypothetical protein